MAEDERPGVVNLELDALGAAVLAAMPGTLDRPGTEPSPGSASDAPMPHAAPLGDRSLHASDDAADRPGTRTHGRSLPAAIGAHRRTSFGEMSTYGTRRQAG